MNKIVFSTIEQLALEQIPKGIATLLADDEPDRFDELLEYTEKWVSGEVKGDKLTVLHVEKGSVVGIVRFWCTPHVNDKWYLEGLQVHEAKRNSGIATKISELGMEALKKEGIKEIFVNISDKNLSSIRVHEKCGFTRLAQTAVNSFGTLMKAYGNYKALL
ncbi:MULTISPECIES: GNAT family N-acetyltransferase [unclassified Fusibacter]|uniref:GNAT family N-acetyltransferase n=1 Tax=unclassified Fusibacter TaxID=2624464 RepID=UPI001011DBDE|nr:MULTISPECIES: GNAT family N-acetyltransferase [unclassified Fusibacter]MCK8060272.1 GNAT family N-acetyltransferase [Fusibacter sp. A2]NPE20439.1 GNAT family N-acetyltransferase [Fusibacter sp. A1]RXV63644.1 GNAT family N-acetyltransferase [Fusibacter sp. A1]